MHIDGYVYKRDEQFQIEAVNEFLEYLRSNKVMKSTFRDMGIETVVKTTKPNMSGESYRVVKFRIYCND